MSRHFWRYISRKPEADTCVRASSWRAGQHAPLPGEPRRQQAAVAGLRQADDLLPPGDLGDNLFHGHGLPELLGRAAAREEGATVFAYKAADPERYGIVEFDAAGQAVSIEEKPAVPRSNWAVTGLYFYDAQACDVAAGLTPSARGEIDITDVTLHYFRSGQLRVEVLGGGAVWLDTGTPDALAQATGIVQGLEARQGDKIGCVEEVAYRMGFISLDSLDGVRALGRRLGSSAYGRCPCGLA